MTKHTIKVGSKEIPLLFGTWAISRFCEVSGNLSFTQMQEVTRDLSLKNIITLILCGAEHAARKAKKELKVDDIDIADWIDEVGGITSQGMADVLLLIAKSINPNYQQIEVSDSGTKEEEKKSQSAGLTSESSVSEPELETVK